MRRIYPSVEKFEGVAGCGPDDYRWRCIPKSYQRLATQAVRQKWGRETVVLQDDVLIPQGAGLDSYNAKLDSPFLIYGQTEPDGQVAPKAFSATPEMWAELGKVWDGKQRIIPAWMPLVETYGLVLDVVRDLGLVGRNAPCRSCGH